MKGLLLLLLIVVIGLSFGWYQRHESALKKADSDGSTINQLSNKVIKTETLLTDQVMVNQVLTNTLAQKDQVIVTTSNQLNATKLDLNRVKEEADAAAKAAAAEIAKRDNRISELETQRDDLTKRMTDLNGQIAGLESSITDTQRKLAASEGDRDFLLQELKRMQDEKVELERQFNDLAMLREQVRRLRDELNISRRLDWIRKGLYGNLKGAERLQMGFDNQPAGGENFDLNVEMKDTGEVKLNGPANAPAAPKP